jgi:hypothetical protein
MTGWLSVAVRVGVLGGPSDLLANGVENEARQRRGTPRCQGEENHRNRGDRRQRQEGWREQGQQYFRQQGPLLEPARQDQSPLPLIQGGAIEVGGPHGRPLVVDEGELRVDVDRSDLVGRLVGVVAPHGEHTQVVSSLPEGLAKVFDERRLLLRIAGNVRLDVQHENDFEVRLFGHAQLEGGYDLIAGEILILDVDVFLRLHDRALMRFEDAGLAVGKILRVGIWRLAREQLARQGAEHLHGDLGVFLRQLFVRNHGKAGAPGVPERGERLIDISDRRPRHGETDVVHQLPSAVARIADRVLLIIEVALLHGGADDERRLSVDDHHLDVQELGTLQRVGEDVRALEVLPDLVRQIHCVEQAPQQDSRARKIPTEHVGRDVLYVGLVRHDPFKPVHVDDVAVFDRLVVLRKGELELGDQVVNGKAHVHELDRPAGRRDRVGDGRKHHGSVHEPVNLIAGRQSHR